MTEQTSCLRCGRRLTARASIGAGYGRTCRARIGAAAQLADLTAFTATQADKARELIEQQAIIPSSRPGLYTAVSSDGVTIYLVSASESRCTCRAAASGHRCYHLAAALILATAALARQAA